MLSMPYSWALQADKLALDKDLKQQALNLQLQEDQSRSVVQQLASLQSKVVDTACKQEKVGA